MLCSHCLTNSGLLWTGVCIGKAIQLDFSAAFARASHCGMLYKLRSIGVGGQLLSSVGILCYRRLYERLDDMVSASDYAVSGGGGQVSDIGPLLFILYTSALFYIIGNHIVGYADDTTISMQSFLGPLFVLK